MVKSEVLNQPSFSGKRVVTVGMFPGQGEQNRFMYKGFRENTQTREVLEEAEEVLGVDPVRVAQDEDMLRKTEWIQPLTVLSSVALTRASTEQGGQMFDMVSGHSLGEYSALVAGGAMTPGAAIGLAHERGKVSETVMSEEDNDGVMAAVSGLTPGQIDAACEQVQEIWPANYNTDEQIVVSGKRVALSALTRVVSSIYPNIKVRIKELDIRGAFHSPMVELAAQRLHPYIAKAKIIDATTPMLSPTTVEWVRSTGEIRRVLVDQFTSQVRFVQTVRRIGAMCAEQEVEDIVFVQIGPDKSDAKEGGVRDLSKGVLLNLVNRITARNTDGDAPKVHTRRVSLPQDIEPLGEYIDKVAS